MGLISPAQVTDGTTINASNVNNPVNTIANEFNGNIDNNNLKAAAAIDPTKLSGGVSGMFAAWATWAPSWTNFTVGNGTLNYAKYIQIGKSVHFRLKFTLGTTSSVGGQIGVTPPINMHADYSNVTDTLAAGGQLNDVDGARWFPYLAWGAANRIDVYYLNAGPSLASTSTSLPFVWATGDQVMIAGTYEGV